MTPSEYLDQLVCKIEETNKNQAYNCREIARTIRDSVRAIDPKLEVTLAMDHLDRLDIDRTTDRSFILHYTQVEIYNSDGDRFTIPIPTGAGGIPTKKMSKSDLDDWLIAHFTMDEAVKMNDLMEAGE